MAGQMIITTFGRLKTGDIFEPPHVFEKFMKTSTVSEEGVGEAVYLTGEYSGRTVPVPDETTIYVFSQVPSDEQERNQDETALQQRAEARKGAE